MKKWHWKTLALVAATCLGFSWKANAEVKPHGLISEGAVLQQKMEAPIWGTARDGETVTVEFQRQKVSTTAKNGLWMVRLKPLSAGGPFSMTIRGENTVEIKDLLVGEVWICSGQSNMEWPLASTTNAEATIAQSSDAQLRLFTVSRAATDSPQSVVNGRWLQAGPESTPRFSAVAFYFGRDLRKALQVPIGLIKSAVGGTPAEAWTSHAILEAHPEFKSILENYKQAVANYPKALEKHKEALEKHKQAVAQAQKEGKQPPRTPNLPYGPESLTRPSGLYNAMIHPLLPYAIRGAIWYQGESNAGRAFQYRTLFPTLIRQWRRDWGQGEFPFLFVQLAPFHKIEFEPKESDWAELREAQLLTTLTVPATGMAVITDVGEQEDVHPRKKEPVGARLALAARGIAYGEKLVYSGPTFAAMKIEGNRAVLSFKSTGGGLAAQGETLKGFTIAGEDKKFVNAQAEIVGKQVYVSSPNVTRPIAVRYGWADYPVVNLTNREGLFASPFRTDDLPMVTKPK